MAGNEETVAFSFFVPNDLNRDNRKVVAHFGMCHLILQWHDCNPGRVELDKMLDILPNIIEHVRNEIGIRREVADLDEDLKDLTDE